MEEPNTFGTDEFIRLCRMLDCVATLDSATGTAAIACINKHETDGKEVALQIPVQGKPSIVSLVGGSPDDYNDIGRDNVRPFSNDAALLETTVNSLRVSLPAHSINIIRVPTKAQRD